MQDVDLRWLRLQIITALAADDDLFEQLILKGGNALSLVHGIGHRASVDIDYSMEGDIEDPPGLGKKIFQALRDRMEPHGLLVFDEKFGPKPSKPSANVSKKWGGYNAEFKLISLDLWEQVEGDLERLRKRALTVSDETRSRRRFKIEISKYEYCEEREQKLVDDGFTCQVYTPSLIAAEKLRSLCQQMEEYGHRAHPTPRARDFYDLHALMTEGQVELSETGMHEVVRAVFAAKSVPLKLIALLPAYHDFHESDWAKVLNSIPAGRARDYEFYYGFVIAECRKLKSLWIENAP